MALGAKMVPFAGFLMPVQYSGIRQEHDAVRKTVGLFDVSHMGNFFVTGPAAREFLQTVTVNNVDKLELMDAQYSALCYDNGTVVDDILVYRLGTQEFKLVVNASNIDKDYAWLDARRNSNSAWRDGVKLDNASERLGILSLQGPKALDVAAAVMDGDPRAVGTYKAGRGKVLGVDMLYSRTGYTGEDGFEFFPENKDLPTLWKALLEAGSRHGILPIGLGARDTLRLEAGYSLYGHELTDKTNLIEAGLSWITDLQKGDFVGRAALDAKAKGGMARKVVGLELQELAIPREGCLIQSGGKSVGVVTSGTMSPTLGKGIAMAYVDVGLAKIGTELEVVIRDAGRKARVTSRHFYKRAKS